TNTVTFHGDHVTYEVSTMLNRLKHIPKKTYTFYGIIFVCMIVSMIFVYNNHSLYDRTIAKITETVVEDTTDVIDRHDNKDVVYHQKITATILNGADKGDHIQISNDYSDSKAYDYEYEVGQEVFINFHSTSTNKDMQVASITDVKRDTYLVIILWVFILTLVLIGKRQGLFASVSLGINIIILSYALDIYVHTTVHLLWISGVTILLFTVLSLLLVNGRNEKTYAAIIATMLGTIFALLITWLAMWVTNENGLRYEEMQFLTRPYDIVFLAGLFIGSLGAVMDVAISISSALFELYDKNNDISVAALKKSGTDIGKDIMGTMTNILFFAYVSGSIPTLILYLKNHSQLGFTLSINLSLEIARALAGGIGIVITIPIGLYTSLYFIQRKRASR